MKTRYIYPAVFTAESSGGYSVSFPDIEGCYTDGENLLDAMNMASDALALMLYQYEAEGKKAPDPSDPKTIHCESGQFVNYVLADTMEYRKRFNNKAVKKTLSIPEWLNEEAQNANINFSQTLQEALREKLNV